MSGLEAGQDDERLTIYGGQLYNLPQRSDCARLAEVLVTDYCLRNALGHRLWRCTLLALKQIEGKEPTIELKRHACCAEIRIRSTNVVKKAGESEGCGAQSQVWYIVLNDGTS